MELVSVRELFKNTDKYLSKEVTIGGCGAPQNLLAVRKQHPQDRRGGA